MPAPPEPITFEIPALTARGRTGGRADPTAARRPKLVGYYTRGATPNYTRLSEYHAWKDHVRLHAPPSLRRLRPVDEPSRVRLDVVCYFATRTHADPENVRKGIVDALFPQGDKWVYGSHDHPRYDPARPRVEVTVTLFSGAFSPAARPPSPPAPRTPAEAGAEAAPTPAAARGPVRRQPPERAKSPPPAREEAGAGAERTRPKPPKSPAAAPAPAKRGFWARLEDWAARWTQEAEKRPGRPAPPASRPRRQGRRRG